MIRITAKAIIEQDGRLLLIKKKLDHVGVYYTLPGGGQELGETLDFTIMRECKEELSINIKILKILCVREYISANHEYSFLQKEVHALEFVYHCAIDVGSQLSSLQSDEGQIGFEWLKISDIINSLSSRTNDIKFPKTLADFLVEYYIHQSIETFSSFKFS